MNQIEIISQNTTPTIPVKHELVSFSRLVDAELYLPEGPISKKERFKLLMELVVAHLQSLYEATSQLSKMIKRRNNGHD